MKFVDVFGPPGVGKSTLCDPIWGHREIGWDGRLPPASWRPLLDEVTNLFILIRKHPSFDAALRMNNRSFRKMATVARMSPDHRSSYVQTGLIQRGLGFGWRLNQMGADVNLIRPFFRLMPVSVGVVHLKADPETIEARNRARLDNPKTAHENRAFMVPLMQEPIRIALEVLRGRGAPVFEIDATQPIDAARRQLIDFAARDAVDAAAHGPGGEIPILSPPPWWQ